MSSEDYRSVWNVSTPMSVRRGYYEQLYLFSYLFSLKTIYCISYSLLSNYLYTRHSGYLDYRRYIAFRIVYFECIERSWRSEKCSPFWPYAVEAILFAESLFLRCRVDGVLVVNFSTAEWRLHPVHPVIPGHTTPGSRRLTTLTSKCCYPPGSSGPRNDRCWYNLRRTSRSSTRARPIRVDRAVIRHTEIF